jgi:hypothetical protein
LAFSCQSFDLFVEDLGFETEDEMEIYLSIPSFKLHVMTASRSSFLLVDLSVTFSSLHNKFFSSNAYEKVITIQLAPNLQRYERQN